MNAGEAATETIKIGGGNYDAVDTQDGYVVVKDVPLMGEVEKGEKGAAKKVGREWHEQAVADALKRHQNDKYTAPAHIGHNDPINKAEFAGFALPKRVGSRKVNDKDQSVIYGDLKIKTGAFERAKRGELPYISVEIADFNEPRISSVSFLDTKPPFFEFPLFTIGNVKTDPQAKFEAKLDSSAAAKFDVGGRDGDEKKPVSNPAAVQCCGHCTSHEDAIARMSRAMGMSYGGKMEEITKPTATPVEPDQKTGVKMDGKGEMDPKVAAQFSLMQDKMAKLEAAATAREKEEAARVLEAKALEDLKSYSIGEATRKQIAKFARVGEKDLSEFIASVKESAPKYPPKSIEEYEAQTVDRADPILAKFQSKGPDAVEKAAKFLAEYKLLKKSAPGYSLTAEQHVDMSFRNL